MIVTEKISYEGRQFLATVCMASYLSGLCYEMAIALHRGLGWSMVGLVTTQYPIAHALVKDPNEENRFFDARGIVSYDDIGEPFGIPPPYALRDISETDLRAVRPVSDIFVESVQRKAEVLWPELPWRDSVASRMVAFAEELEALSRKHGLWIRGSCPALRPHVAEAFGREAGYVLTPLDDGGGYLIDRLVE